MESDIAYFRRRASDERSAALQARDPRAREAHVQMAERYEDLVRGMARYDEHLGLTLVTGRRDERVLPPL